MNLVEKIKWWIKSILESHPLGYFIGNKIVNLTDFTLPHEEDFYGFKKLAKKSNGLFLDIGANDGKSARSFNKIIKNWSIFSIEANPLHSVSLQNLKNKLPRFNFLIAAAGQPEEQLTLYTPKYKNIIIHSAASVDLEQAERQMKKQFVKKAILDKISFQETPINIIHLDELHLEPDIIKIDIEGHEHIALRCLEKTIQTSRPFILVEYNPANFEIIKDHILKLDYMAYGYDIEKDQFVEFKQHRNCFLIPTEKRNF